jgi:hypothetical protein
MVLRQAARGERGVLLFNVVGGEFPDLVGHVRRVAELTGWPLEATTPGYGLHERIRHYDALPNQWMRWCTRELKIEPTVAWLKAHPGSTLCVGLRADEPADERGGIYGPCAEYRYPLREWGWGLAEVNGYLAERGVEVPRRTNCPLCYGQRLGEWWRLWREHPDLWAEGEALEAETGHTFRSPGRDTWPAAMAGLRRRFEAGDTPKSIRALPLLGDFEDRDDSVRGVCRVCTL